MKDEILEEIRKRGLQNNITLCGTTKQVTQKLAEASIFISTSDFEGISNSMLEAMAVGLPMVCTDCPIGGARLMLGDGAGLLSEVGNIKQFAENLDGLLHNHDKCRLMSAFAKEKASQYTLLNIAQRWIDVFNKLKNDYMTKVLEVIYGFGYGGIRAFIMNYLNFLDKDKFKVDIYVFGYESSPFTDKVKELGANIFLSQKTMQQRSLGYL